MSVVLFLFAQESSGGSGSGGDSASGSEAPSSASSCPPPEDDFGKVHKAGTVEVIHSSVSDAAGSYFDLRAQSAAEAGAEAGFRPPPLRAAAVARRRARLRALRDGAAPGAGGPPGACRDGATLGALPAAALQEVARQLRCHGFAVVDGLLGSVAARQLRGALRDSGSWASGVMGGEASRARVLRGDLVAWPDAGGQGPLSSLLRGWLAQVDALVGGLRPLLPRKHELAGVSVREPPMASRYPTGARYIRHYDNNCDSGAGSCNGRRLTAVYYLNEAVSDADGGHLRVVARCGRSHDVLPSLDVLALFWADRRTPHEVLPNKGSERYALSCWYVDSTEAPAAPEASLWEAASFAAAPEPPS